MKRLVWSIPLLLVVGCGVTPSDNSLVSDDVSLARDSTAGDLVDPRTISTPVPVRADGSSFDAPTDSSLTQLLLDPFTGFLLDAVGIDVLISLLFNDSTVDQLDPSGPRINDSLTFLERLCREGDSPDFVCRNRYGN